MLFLPKTLSLITTHQCTAACDHCCFSCTPKVTKRIPYEKLIQLINDAAQIPSMQVVVFTGGECFLLGEQLNRLIELSTSHQLKTRCITNGYWAVNEGVAQKRVQALVDSGLKEINFSTGEHHSKFVPIDRIIHGAVACSELGITTLINIEITQNSTFPTDTILKNDKIVELMVAGKLRVQRNVWIENGGTSKICHDKQYSTFCENKMSGCSNVLNVLTVTPDQNVVVCCGLHLEKIPELSLGSVKENGLLEVVAGAKDDFLKVWLHVKGPERILEFVKKKDPDYVLPAHYVHPCETCLHLYKDKKAQEVVKEHFQEIETEVLSEYMAGVSNNILATLGGRN